MYAIESRCPEFYLTGHNHLPPLSIPLLHSHGPFTYAYAHLGRTCTFAYRYLHQSRRSDAYANGTGGLILCLIYHV